MIKIINGISTNIEDADIASAPNSSFSNEETYDPSSDTAQRLSSLENRMNDMELFAADMIGGVK